MEAIQEMEKHPAALDSGVVLGAAAIDLGVVLGASVGVEADGGTEKDVIGDISGVEVGGETGA